VNFTGGEPTLFPNFLKLLAFAKKIGYTIYVGTNGTLFASEEFAKEALEYIDELSFSIHWFNAQTCKAQTGLERHFEVFQLAARNVKKYRTNQFFFSNIVLNKLNYETAPEIIKFIHASDFPVQQVLISNIAPEGKADHHF
jgi:MoaA/NifB/PqqE/SkfB family radical SAM enzyme